MATSPTDSTHVATRTSASETPRASVICNGVREAGVDRGWPEPGARRSFVAGSARPAWTVGGPSQARVGHRTLTRPEAATTTRRVRPLAGSVTA